MNKFSQEESKTTKHFGVMPAGSDSDSSEAEYAMVQADAEYFNQEVNQVNQSEDEVLGGQLSKEYASAVYSGKRKKGFKPIKDICKRDKPLQVTVV